MNTKLADLCRDLGREFPSTDFDELVDDACLEVDGVVIALDADDESCIGELTAFVDMGAVDSARKLEVLERALAFNLSGESGEHGVLGLDDDTGHLVMVSSIEWVPGATVAGLVEKLRSLARFRGDFENSSQGLMPQGARLQLENPFERA